MHNTEDKQWWVIEWRKKEELFVNQVCPKLNLTAIINPAKKNNPFVPDIIVDRKLADLKCQQTPFFKAYVLYKIPQQYAVTFNKKDYLSYSTKYPDILIYYWLDWQELKKIIRGEVFEVKPMSGVWKVDFKGLEDLIIQKEIPLHTYQRRVGDNQGNALDSYVFDIRRFDCLFQNRPD